MANFNIITPEAVIEAAEQATGIAFSGLVYPHASYINRVYELQAKSGERWIIKFYRPDRWDADAILDEHEFIQDCIEEEIPVIPPIAIDESTLFEVHGIYYSMFPKKWGHVLEVENDDSWLSLGRIVGRCHKVGYQFDAKYRMKITPDISTQTDIKNLLPFITPLHKNRFVEVTNKLQSLIIPKFDGVPLLRIHGDLHMNNILQHSSEGLMLIDFDDMAMGPAVQDLWLMLPGRVNECGHVLNLLLEGYEQFCDFDDYTLQLVEPLRAMRMLYFNSWCAMQINDPVFKQNFPNWGNDEFWNGVINDLWLQVQIIEGSYSAL
ncbi:MAG: serine/threonine protein kinase [Lentisphaeria bacterium]|nr:serine/threonine protein kinase [Lentisphaeria bacterium]